MCGVLKRERVTVYHTNVCNGVCVCVCVCVCVRQEATLLCHTSVCNS